MVSCARFQFRAGADPASPGFWTLLHAWFCPPCARYLMELRQLDREIRRAFVLRELSRARTQAVRSGVAVGDAVKGNRACH